MRYLKPILFVSIVSVSFMIYNKSHNVNLVERNGLLYAVNSTIPYSGEMKITSTEKIDGQEKKWISEEAYIKDGKIEGILTVWDYSGNKIEESEYHDGQLNGRSRKWASNGQLLADCKFLNNKAQPNCTEYFQNGEIKKTLKATNSGLELIEKSSQYNPEITITRFDTSYNKLYNAIFRNDQCMINESFFRANVDTPLIERKIFSEDNHNIVVSGYHKLDINNLPMQTVEFEIIDSEADCITNSVTTYEKAKLMKKSSNVKYYDLNTEVDRSEANVSI